MKTLIIAEAGVNHNGKLSQAKKLIKEAKNAGADVVKFQYFKAENLAISDLKLAPYQKINSKFKNQFEMLKNLELSERDFIFLSKYSKKLGIKFCLSFFDDLDIEITKKCYIDYIKIPSGEINNIPLIIKAALLNKNLIFSTGMSNYKEIKQTIKIMLKKGLERKKISILQCTSSYPAPYKDLNLKVMDEFKKKFKLNVGFSDHSLGIEASIAAVALGAKVIEKHFTLDKKLSGPDHKASLNPNELKKMITSIRNIEKSMGFEKKIMFSEKKNFKLVRKKIVAKKSIKKGDIFHLYNLAIKRTNSSTGLNPKEIYRILGKKSLKNYNKDTII